jgi:thiosulfate/3-mercaptopyruvate sulfurtransferase
VIALAAHRLGHPGVAVYDGSWSEWGGRDDTPVETGPAA